ncbi:MAG: hypothetical protein GWO41_08465, partial [candidate division Zixibacteria bacterium]|nr:hypothetical protein [candidate division Zixibacteria bacterium]NIT52753.1 hypothetical protein [candidate division Zixibacteria bacterium]NIU16837.1 hypothetical protein [candidate division Zixibacteria bacterium]NIV09002.1 hypothetical protein [candidate division Zixibacteria bacterium]NIW40956.1 hypothetical protein [candidate division Zixibacteria bacterium]
MDSDKIIPEKYNLVVVDDEKFICEIVKEVLSDDDRYSARYFSSPSRALNFINSHPVDLV